MNKDSAQMMKQALLEIRRLKAELKNYEKEKNPEIAIIGMGCKFPGGASSPEAYWKLIFKGVDAVGDVPESRWDHEAFYSSRHKAGKIYTDQGGFINDVDKFDPMFFGITPREAEFIDPQHRLLLEVCWEALENAGVPVTRDAEPANTGVFIGLTTNDYLTDMVERKGYTTINSFYGIGNAHNAASGRISHTFGFAGPSMTIDTACSSSLTSVHLACQALLNNECKMAIAGGVNTLLNPVNSIITAQAKMLSPEGRCKTFDDAADGYIRSEGCGALVLMRLEDAIEQNKNVLAVIKGSGVNHNATSSSITVPNMSAQAALIKSVLKKSNIQPEEVTYIEAHGTGTNLGDPIELRALQQVYANSHNKSNPLYVGSVKSNIGHTESAAGIAGIIKTVLSLRKKTIPGNIHFKQPNTNINWDGLPFVIPTAPQKWNVANGKSRIAGVSSFGVSGTNAHILLQEYLQEEIEANQSNEMTSWVFALSAKTKTALAESKKQLVQFLSDQPEKRLRDICLSSLRGRTHFEYRIAKEVNSMESLKQFLLKEDSAKPTESKRIAFICPGTKFGLKEYVQGLFEKNWCGRQYIDEADKITQELSDYKLSEVIKAKHYELNDVDVLCLEYCIAQMWINWGVKPKAITGQGIGLFSAAIIAGYIRLKDGAKWLLGNFNSTGNIKVQSARFQLLTYSNDVVSLDDIQSPDFWRSATQKSAQKITELSTTNITVSLRKNEKLNTIDSVNKQLVALFTQGKDINFEKVYTEKYNFPELPNYPFEKERYWLEGYTEKKHGKRVHPFCKHLTSYAKDSNIQIIENYIEFDQIRDHCIHNKVTVPGAAYVELLLAAGNLQNHHAPIAIKNISFTKTVLLENKDDIVLQSVAEKKGSESAISLYYHTKGGVFKYCSGGTLLEYKDEKAIEFETNKLNITGKTYQGFEIYAKLNEYGYAYGTTYQGIKELTINNDTIIGFIDIPEAIQNNYKDYVLHPALLDACLQLAGAELIQRKKQDPFVPVFIGDLTVYRNEFNALRCHVQLRKSLENSTLSADYHIFNQRNEPVAVVKNVIFRQLQKKKNLSLQKDLYITDWQVLDLNITGKKKIEKTLLISQKNTHDGFVRSVLKETTADFEEVHAPNDISKALNKHHQTDQVIVDFVGSNQQPIEASSMETRLLHVLTILQELLKNSGSKIPEIVLITSLETGKQLQRKSSNYNELLSLTSIVNQEEPMLKMRTIAINPNEGPEQLQELLFAEFDVFEERLKIENNVVYGQRLIRPEKQNLNLNKPYKLKIDEPGSFSDLEVKVIEPLPPKLDEIGLSVVASGVNFKEVLYALGALPMPKGSEAHFEFGFECSGIVTSVGENVKDINIGDEVIAIIAPGSLGSYTVVHKNFIFPKPKELTFEEAATLPIVFITAYYALMNLARIKKSTKILIHAAAGGVGLAAVQIAKLIEAEIYASASTPKHALLKSKGLSHVYNSRTLDFADQIKQDTNHEGLDVVLNSFSGDFMFKSLELVKKNGCFVEIGKVNQETIDKIKTLRPDVVYHNFDIGEIAQVNHELIRSVFDAVLEKMQSKQLKPIQFTPYPITQVEQAFATFAKGKNIGKVIITHYQNTNIPLFYPEEFHLITGGNGGLGSHFMHWMFEKGARNFIIVSRSGQPQANELHEKLIEKGALIRYENVDVANEESVQVFFDKIHNEKCNLRGIFHAAGVLNDKLIVNQSLDDARDVFNPKVKGTSHLDQYSRAFNLKHFVCFSSIASVFGTVGQFSYAGANGAMDVVMHNRRRLGLPGISINWGPFADSGMASTLKMQTNGVNKLSVQEHFEAVEIAIRRQWQQLCVAAINWDELSESASYYRKSTLFNRVRAHNHYVNTNIVTPPIVAKNIPQLIEQNIKAVLGLAGHHEVAPTRSLFDYGLDSLMAVELKNKIEKITGEEISSTFLFNHPTLKDIIGYFTKDSQAKTAENEPDTHENLSVVDSLSMLLDEELKDLE
jgi:acyl transferase domain-containing protein/NADPH:quinone reductase-like Zn-dependent oxidoreductase/acyl carrier protein